MTNKALMYKTGEYQEKNTDWHRSDSIWKAKHIYNILTSNQLTVTSVAEMGCGSGAILAALEKYLPDCDKFTGYDISPHAIDMANKLKSKKTNFKCLDITESTTNFHQVMLMIDVFEHVEDYFGLLKTVRERADYFIFHIPIDMYALSVLLDYQITSRNNYGHLHYFSQATALRTLEDCNYTIIDWFYTKPGWELPPEGKVSPFKAKILKFPRKLLFYASPSLVAKTLGGCSIMVLAK